MIVTAAVHPNCWTMDDEHPGIPDAVTRSHSAKFRA